MKIFFVRLAPLLALVSFASLDVLVAIAPAATPPAEKKSREQIRAERKVVQDEVMRVDKELNDALLRANVTVLARLLTKDYVETFEKDVMFWDGGRPRLTTQTVPEKKRTKDELLAGLKSGTIKISSLELSHQEVSAIGHAALMGGETAILAGRLIVKGTFKGPDTSGDFLLTRNYRKVEGRWLCSGANLNPLVLKP